MRRTKWAGLLFLAGNLFVLASAHGQLITGNNILAETPAPKPAAFTAYNDPAFAVTATRITDAVASNQPGLFPQYSKRQAWNADESFLLLTSDDGSFRLYNGQTYQFIRTVESVSGEDVFWHPGDPQVVWYNNGNELRWNN